MRFGKLSAALVVFLSPVVSAHIDQAMYYCLTDTGEIMLKCTTVIHTDANIRFLHSARNTIFKVRKDGAIYDAGFTDFDGSISTAWHSLGKDANINTRRRLTGGDNTVFQHYQEGIFDEGLFRASLFKHSGSNVYYWRNELSPDPFAFRQGGSWGGGEWMLVDKVPDPGWIRGGYKSEERSIDTFQLMEIGDDSVIVRPESQDLLYHKGRFVDDYVIYNFEYEDSVALIARQSDGRNFIMEYINKTNGVADYTVRNVASAHSALWVNWRETATGKHELWRYQTNVNFTMSLVMREKILDMAAENDANYGPMLFVLMADGKTVKQADYRGNLATVATAPAGKKFVQVLAISQKARTDDNER